MAAPEIEAVLKASPNLRPCEPKYGRIPYDEFLNHIVNDRCVQCRAFFLHLDKELKMMSYLRDHKKLTPRPYWGVVSRETLPQGGRFDVNPPHGPSMSKSSADVHREECWAGGR